MYSRRQNIRDLKISLGIAAASFAASVGFFSGMLDVSANTLEEVDDLKVKAYENAGPIFDTVFKPAVQIISSVDDLNLLSESGRAGSLVASCIKKQWEEKAALPSQEVAVDIHAARKCFQHQSAATDPAAERALDSGSTIAFMGGVFALMAGGIGVGSLAYARKPAGRMVRYAAHHDLPPVSTVKRFFGI